MGYFSDLDLAQREAKRVARKMQREVQRITAQRIATQRAEQTEPAVFRLWFSLNGQPNWAEPFSVECADLQGARDVWDCLTVKFYPISTRP